MNPGQRVITRYGRGTVVRPEGTEGVLSERYLIKLDDLTVDSLRDAHCSYGGLYFHESEIKIQKR